MTRDYPQHVGWDVVDRHRRARTKSTREAFTSAGTHSAASLRCCLLRKEKEKGRLLLFFSLRGEARSAPRHTKKKERKKGIRGKKDTGESGLSSPIERNRTKPNETEQQRGSRRTIVQDRIEERRFPVPFVSYGNFCGVIKEIPRGSRTSGNPVFTY